MSDIQLRIMIIDDNVAIHQDFIKVLTSTSATDQMQDLDKILFEDELQNGSANDPEINHSLPQFIFDTASQGKEGVDKIAKALEKGEHYALAFVDIRMPPGWDGIETIKRMWEIDPDIQVVICTAYSDYSWEDTVKKLGIGDNFLILKKPFDLVAVRQLACALTKKWILAKDSKHYTEVLQQAVKDKTESLQQSLSLLRSTIESSTEAILVVDLENKIIDCNTKFLSMWSVSPSLLNTKDGELVFEYMLNQLVKPKMFSDHMDYLRENIDKVSKEIVDLKTGTILECCSQPHRMNDQTIGRVWSFRNITEQANLEKKLEYQASHDMLTGLPNRVLLMDRIQHGIDKAQRNSQLFAVLFFDLDRFKLVNDSLSHKVGDDLLRLVAKRLSGLVRKEDTIARLGGDEFVMVIPQLHEDDDIIVFANKILNSFKQSFKIAKREIIVSTSIGISLYPNDGTTVNKLLKNADLAMYQAKERGGNQFQFHTNHLNAQASKRFKVESELRKAIENEEFVLLYQPQFDMDNKSLLSAEALIRWEHPEKGLLLPLDFIPIAEESGLIVPIGEWVIRESCRQINDWMARKLPLIRIAVNVATQQLKQPNFDQVVKGILEEFGVDPQYLEMEITENVIIMHHEIIQMINKLKEVGVKIVLDDFGTGNSSLNYLRQINIDRLKIDQSFVQNISTSRSDEVIIEAIISMGRSFNFKILAEGVETQNQMNFLKSQNCDEVQGYLLSKPLSAKHIEQYIKKNRQELK
ncbi:MAG: EAL domain-containing protein [Legionella sp.]|nr:MAG: EAL domain-containing protein [Legionella sp.]